MGSLMNMVRSGCLRQTEVRETAPGETVAVALMPRPGSSSHLQRSRGWCPFPVHPGPSRDSSLSETSLPPGHAMAARVLCYLCLCTEEADRGLLQRNPKNRHPWGEHHTDDAPADAPSTKSVKSERQAKRIWSRLRLQNLVSERSPTLSAECLLGPRSLASRQGRPRAPPARGTDGTPFLAGLV